MRFVPETANRTDWPRLVAQAINELIRRPAGGGSSLALDGGDASGSSDGIAIDGGGA